MEDIVEKAVTHVKVHIKDLIQTIAGDQVAPRDQYPISLFMSGHAGAGKTEFTRALTSLITDTGFQPAALIDPDAIREKLPGYNGSNSELFQRPVSLAVEKLHDYVLSKGKNFIMDGTFSHWPICRSNLERSLRKNRIVFIFHVHQDPKLSWEITKAREAKTGRHVPKKAFIEQVFATRECIREAKKEFGNQIKVTLIIKDAESKRHEVKSDVSNIDDHVQMPYTKDELEGMLQ